MSKREIIYGNYDIDVQFEDGSIAKSKRYLSFQGKHGRSIRNPNRFKKEQLKLKFICKNGLFAKIIDYNDSQNISVIFEDEIIVKNKCLKDLRIGNIKNPYFNKSNKKMYGFPIKNIAYQWPDRTFYYTTLPNGEDTIITARQMRLYREQLDAGIEEPHIEPDIYERDPFDWLEDVIKEYSENNAVQTTEEKDS